MHTLTHTHTNTRTRINARVHTHTQTNTDKQNTFMHTHITLICNQTFNRNIRNEINAAELHAVFLPFGSISFCNFIGVASVLALPDPIGPVTVRTALLEYTSVASAAECSSSMHGFDLGGVTLVLEPIDQATMTTLKGDLKTVVVHSG
jgi:hypothetical protein